MNILKGKIFWIKKRHFDKIPYDVCSASVAHETKHMLILEVDGPKYSRRVFKSLLGKSIFGSPEEAVERLKKEAEEKVEVAQNRLDEINRWIAKLKKTGELKHKDK